MQRFVFEHRFSPGRHAHLPVSGGQKKSQHSKLARQGWPTLRQRAAPASRAPTSDSTPPPAAAASTFSTWRRDVVVASALESSSSFSSLMALSSLASSQPPEALGG